MTTSVSCYSVFTYRITWIVGKVFYWFFSILSELEDAVSQTWTKTQTSKWDDIYVRNSAKILGSSKCAHSECSSSISRGIKLRDTNWSSQHGQEVI